MKKINVMILVILLAIGFAAVSTTLIINGTLNIAANTTDFDVYFSNAIENGKQKKSLIKDDTHIAFNQEMSLKGETYVLDYDVTNGSRNYDADLSINCTESNEYLKVTNEFDEETILPATETRTGKLTVEVLKSYVGTEEEPTKDIEITCEIVASAVERDTLSTGTPADKVKRVWKITEDNDNDGELSKGDLITLGTESFYVYDIEGDNVKAISQYNLYMGNKCSSASSCSSIENATGLQDSRAKGAVLDSEGNNLFPFIGVVPFTTEEKYTNEVRDVSESEKKRNDYSISLVKEYVDAYATKLSELDGEVQTVRLVTKEELEKAGCDYEKLSCRAGYVWNNSWTEDETFEGAPAYFYSTTYWTESPNTENDDIIFFVFSLGAFGDSFIFNDYELGVRPVIELSKSLF